MAKYGIKITYSNGDEEDGLYGNFASKEEAFKEICVLAAKEAYVQNEDFDELKTPNPSISNYINKKLSCTQSESLFYTKKTCNCSQFFFCQHHHPSY